MKSVIVSAKSLDMAIEEGLAILNTTFENVDVNIITQGGFLKKFKVEIILNEDETEKSAKPKKSEKPKHDTQKEVEQKTNILVETKKPVLKEEGLDTELDSEIKKIEEELKEITEQKTEKPAKTKKQEEIDLVKEEVKIFLEGLIYNFNIIAEIESEFKEGNLFVRIVGENLGFLIGHHGDSLQAIQYLLNNIVFNKTRSHIRIILDIENYRKKRVESLKKLSTNIAEKVIANKRSYKLEAMTSIDRKTIHAHLQDMKNIKTHSEGKEPNRYLVINYVE